MIIRTVNMPGMEILSRIRTAQVSLLYLLPLRLFLAYIWLNGGIGKIQSILANPEVGAGMAGVFGEVWAKANPYPWMVEFLKNSAAPSAASIYMLVALGELFVGLFLLLGLATRLAAGIGILMNAFFLLAAGHTSPSTYSVNLLMIGTQLTFLLTPPGRILGVDQFLRKKISQVPIG